MLKFRDSSGAKVCKSCRSRKTLQNEYLVAKIGVDTAENGPKSAVLRAEPGDFRAAAEEVQALAEDLAVTGGLLVLPAAE